MISFLAALCLIAATPSSLDVKIVLNGKGLAGQTVELISVNAEHKMQTTSQKTNAKGIASFSAAPVSKKRFVLRTTFEGMNFFSGLITTDLFEKKPFEMTVYRSKPSSPEVKISDLRLFVKPSGDEIEVEETFVIDNPTPFAIRGESKTPHNMPPGMPPHAAMPGEVFRFSIPSGVVDVKYGEGFERGGARVEENDVIVTSELLPGQKYFNLTLTFERSGQAIAFEQTTSLPVKNVSVASPVTDLSFMPPLMAGPRKHLDSGWVQTWEADKGDRKGVMLIIRGLPRPFNLTYTIPFLVLGLMLAFALYKHKGLSSTASPAGKEDLLKEIVTIENLLNKGLIDQEEYDRRLLVLYDQIRPYYEAA